jgi:dimeric dUTPase (all-alpha-NTP-PPase superfamily)
MLSRVQLITMLKLQDEMNSKINTAWVGAGYEYLRAAMVESVEGIEHHGWKWWKGQQKDLPQLQMELVDIWHFALSSIIIEFDGDLDRAAITISKSLTSDQSSVTFDGKPYEFKDLDILSNLELMTGLCAAKRFEVPLFLHIVVQAEMSADDLYKQYVGKNILNSFRSDHGYKDGSYIKIWDKREDNEHLVDILNTQDVSSVDYRQKIYSSLKQRYPSKV